MHSRFIANPAIVARKAQIEWTFWDIHTGEVDIAHREKLKRSLHSFVTRHPEQLKDLVQGYKAFAEEPHQRLTGKVGQHLTMFLFDPFGNALEFKAFDDPAEAFLTGPTFGSDRVPS
jgi:hypothetical protein